MLVWQEANAKPELGFHPSAIQRNPHVKVWHALIRTIAGLVMTERKANLIE
jgi:hypothetical protein